MVKKLLTSRKGETETLATKNKSISSPVTIEVRHCFCEHIVKLSRIYNFVSFIYIPKARQHLRESWHGKKNRDKKKTWKSNTGETVKTEQEGEEMHLPWVSLPLWRTSRACKIWAGSSPVGHMCETNTGQLHLENTGSKTKEKRESDVK